MTRALDGIRVVELATEIQGPYAGLTLSEMGADVVKVENKAPGDTSRTVPLSKMVGPQPPERADFRHYFYTFNRGKRSITLDLKSDGGREVLRRLLADADVLISNFRIGVLERLGFGYEALAEHFPGLVYAVASGWGRRGPRTQHPSRDMIAQAASGLMAKTGLDPDPPLPAGTNIADYSGAHMLVTAVLAALVQRGRTGRGQRVDVSLYGTMVAHHSWELFQAGLVGRDPHRAGHAHPHMEGAWGGFRTKDGWLILSGVQEPQWQSFCALIDRPDLAADPHWTGQTRNVDGAAFRKIIEDAFVGRTTAEWMARLAPADILVTPAASYMDVLSDAQAIENDYVRTVEHPQLGPLKMVGSPIEFGGAALRRATAAPALGEDTDTVLAGLGYDAAAIAAMRASGAI